jgi:hypothetical protein
MAFWSAGGFVVAGGANEFLSKEILPIHQVDAFAIAECGF